MLSGSQTKFHPQDPSLALCGTVCGNHSSTVHPTNENGLCTLNPVVEDLIIDLLAQNNQNPCEREGYRDQNLRY